jgi:hypothetical protein
MRKFIVLQFLLCATLIASADTLITPFNGSIKVQGPGAQYIEEIEILNSDGRKYDSYISAQPLADGVFRIELGLGESMSKVLNLNPAQDSNYVFKIEQQYETSITIMNEGPHIDLVDWKHHVSEWQALKATKDLTFISTEVSSIEFPQVTKKQIVDALKEASKGWPREEGNDPVSGWIRLANKCETPNTYPCGVGVSKIRLRISVLKDGNWIPVQTIELIPPMGC